MMWRGDCPRNRTGIFYPDPRHEGRFIVQFDQAVKLFEASLMYGVWPNTPFEKHDGWVKLKYQFLVYTRYEDNYEEYTKVCNTVSQFQKVMIARAREAKKMKIKSVAYFARGVLNFEGGRSIPVNENECWTSSQLKRLIPAKVRKNPLF